MFKLSITSLVACGFMMTGCASSPKGIEAAYVSPLRYQSYTCEQLGAERVSVETRAKSLYRTLKKRSDGDVVKAGVGAVLFFPALFFLKGNGAKGAEFAQLKGEYQALQISSGSHGCNIPFNDLEAISAG